MLTPWIGVLRALIAPSKFGCMGNSTVPKAYQNASFTIFSLETRRCTALTCWCNAHPKNHPTWGPATSGTTSELYEVAGYSA